MAYSLLAHTIKQSTDSNGVTSSAINTTGANLIVLLVADYGSQSATAISDSQSNTWSTAVTKTDTARVRVMYCYAPTTNASHTFTATQNGSYVALVAMAFSGAASSPLDQTNSNGGTGVTSIQPGSVTPTQDNELVICGISGNAPGAPDSLSVNGGFTVADSGVNVTGTCFGIAAAYLIQTTAAAANPTFSWTTSSGSQTVSATFKANASSTVTGAGSSAGVATASGVGAGRAASAGSIAGVATVSGVGARRAAAAGSAAGVATVSGVGAGGGWAAVSAANSSWSTAAAPNSTWVTAAAPNSSWSTSAAPNSSWSTASSSSTTWTVQ